MSCRSHKREHAIAYHDETGSSPRSLWGAVGLQVALCAYLWLFPATVASRLLRPGTTPENTIVSFAQWQHLAFVVVGVFVLARAIPDIMYWTILIAAMVAPASTLEELALQQKINAFSSFIELAIGLCLVLGANGLRAAIFKLRTAGVSPNRAET